MNAHVSDTPEQRAIAQGTAVRLRELISEQNTSAASLSYDLRVNAGLVSRWLKGETMMSAKYIIAVCEHYNVSADWLLGLSPVKHPARTTPLSDEEAADVADALAESTPPRARSTRPKRSGT